MELSDDVISTSVECQKIFKEVTIEEIKDRISSLPDEILLYILSFLPTKYAVGTCILSTRWKYLWTSLPNLDFDDQLLLHTKRHVWDSIGEMRFSFSSVVERVLILHNGSYIQRFRLKCDKNYEPSHVNAWICAALQRNVRELDLCFSISKSEVLPHDLFSCGTLVSLKLSLVVLDIPASVGLPKLKTLHLESIEFPDDKSVLKLFSGCPVLEELHIKECELREIHVLNISAFALKSLTIKCTDLHFDQYMYKIIINAPRLECLKLIGYVAEAYLVKNLESLIEAYVHVYVIRDLPNVFFHFIRGISNVKILHLLGDSIAGVLLSRHKLPVFHNMIYLELDVCKGTGWHLLSDLLQNSPNLESLSFWEGLDNLSDGEFQWSPPERVPHCLLHCLKIIKIWEFGGLKEELKLVEYFLNNASVLDELKIATIKKLNISEKLLMFPRGSKTCQVVVY